MFNPFKRKEDEQKMKESGRMPPGQSLTQRFPCIALWTYSQR